MISFIIPAHNEVDLLGRTLRALHDAAEAVGRRYELVVVDDASTDGTAAVALAGRARLVQVNRRQISAARNEGASRALGELFVFVDADTLVNQAVLSGALAATERGAVGGGCAFRFDGPLPWHGRSLQAVAVPLYRYLRLASGCFLFCRRDAFFKAGGFSEELFGAEEVALSRALGRLGRFEILRSSVTTSGRKLRSYSAWEIWGTLARLALMGPKSVRQRDGLEIWYGERRSDPASRR